MDSAPPQPPAFDALRVEPKAAPMLTLTYSYINDRAAFEALEPEWRMLLREHGRQHDMFLEFNWLWHWANTFLWHKQSRSRELAIIIGRHQGEIALILPLVLETRLGFKTIKWMGEPVSQYGDALCSPVFDRPEIWRTVFSYVEHSLKPDVMHLRKVRADARVAGYLAARGQVTEQAEAPFITIATNVPVETFETVFSAKDRKNRRRHRRRLAETGEIAFATFSRCDRAATALRQAIALKRGWLAKRQLVSKALISSKFEAFFEAALCDNVRPTGCELSLLTVSGRPAAITIGLVHAHGFAAHLTSYDPALEQFSPGSLLLEDNLRHQHARNVTRYDLLAPAYKYKHAWATGEVAVADYAIALTRRGQVFRSLYLAGIRALLHRLVEHQSSRGSRLLARLIRLVRLG